MSQYTDGGYKTTLLACNYASGNMGGQPVYKTGENASDCTSNNEKYTSLCAAGDPAITP